jgi:hypothetical protein
VSTALPVDVAEDTLVKQADLWPCGSLTMGTNSKDIFYEIRNKLRIIMRKIKRQLTITQRLCELRIIRSSISKRRCFFV